MRARNQLLKTNFFKNLMKIEEEAPHIADMLMNAHEQPGGERKTQSDISNNCFQQEAGKWVLNLKNPYLQMTKSSYSCSRHAHERL